MDNYKQCASCAKTKLVEQFYKQSNSPDGRRRQCKDCFNVIRKLSYQKNKQKAADYGRAYRAANREKTIQSQRTWRKNNKDKYLLNIHRRRLRMSNAETFVVTKKDLAKILAQPCIYCGAASEHIDHVIPISRNGNHSIGNLAPACGNCNRSKHNKFITEWKMSQRTD